MYFCKKTQNHIPIFNGIFQKLNVAHNHAIQYYNSTMPQYYSTSSSVLFYNPQLNIRKLFFEISVDMYWE